MFRNYLYTPARVISHGFLIDIEAEEGTSVELMTERLAGACTWVEGVGHTDVDYLGEIEQIEDPALEC